MDPTYLAIEPGAVVLAAAGLAGVGGIIATFYATRSHKEEIPKSEYVLPLESYHLTI